MTQACHALAIGITALASLSQGQAGVCVFTSKLQTSQRKSLKTQMLPRSNI
jgi:hypothetical protein